MASTFVTLPASSTSQSATIVQPTAQYRHCPTGSVFVAGAASTSSGTAMPAAAVADEIALSRRNSRLFIRPSSWS
jgi:hypothetical protein